MYFKDFTYPNTFQSIMIFIPARQISDDVLIIASAGLLRLLIDFVFCFGAMIKLMKYDTNIDYKNKKELRLYLTNNYNLLPKLVWAIRCSFKGHTSLHILLRRL